MKLKGENRGTRGKTCPSATLSITNPTWTDPGSNPSLRGERSATNRLSHGTDFNMSHSDAVDFISFIMVRDSNNIAFRFKRLIHERIYNRHFNNNQYYLLTYFR
jgi:hypothetical protein